MTFKIYDSPTGGTALWSMTSNEVAVNNGLYTVQLGPLTGVDLASGRRWLEVTVGTDTLSPRLEILAVAYALVAGTAATSEYASTAGIAAYAGTAISAETANTATTANTANYATLAGSVKGPVSAEAGSNGYSLFINGGKLGIKTGANMIVGTGTISNGASETVIANASVTDSSIIFLTVGVTTNTDLTGRGLKVKARSAGNFTVGTISGGNVDSDLPFSYLIIN